ncbi:hypothetical protein BDK51DRAFT_53267 [Blyttiomyces helicus]|uniref:Mon2/Sec7/BIG1-like dimerisation and cyclophilin-binding domain-containing protein n=1 Tax=Blyttiomyces helicus TaxID=388810 RepID=A0A4P9WAR1_9FUNG|nr:hypothetical protein BDK51DRAFT_53267 [Blyttiomyces helicus]|eukprot:RKO89544.1 hypothetical protein BDK51DRAFT_53267 [Blyttiomyces helicus]
MSQALLLCFRLQDTKAAVVNNTAAATVRQLVIFVFDKVSAEDTQGGGVRRPGREHPPLGANGGGIEESSAVLFTLDPPHRSMLTGCGRLGTLPPSQCASKIIRAGAHRIDPAQSRAPV